MVCYFNLKEFCDFPGVHGEPAANAGPQPHAGAADPADGADHAHLLPVQPALHQLIRGQPRNSQQLDQLHAVAARAADQAPVVHITARHPLQSTH
jgi:hypothetical protein